MVRDGDALKPDPDGGPRIAFELTRHIKDAKERLEFKRMYLNSEVRKILLEALDRRLETLETNETNYDIASWAYQQAHYNGVRETLIEIRRLLAIDE